MNDYFRNERQFTEYQQGSLQIRHTAMNDAYMNHEYNESVNLARTLIESTCKYVYHELTGKEIEVAEGTKTHVGYNISLYKMIEKCLEQTKGLMTYKEDLDNISDNLCEIVSKIGEIRNSSSLSHGSRHRDIPIQKHEARFIISISEDICMLLMDLLFERTIVHKHNAIGSIIDKQGLKQYGDAYQTEGDPIFDVRFETFGDIIYTISLTFKKCLDFNINGDLLDINIEGDSIDDYIKDYLPDDVGSAKTIGPLKYNYYSDSQDKNYEVVCQKLKDKLLVTITGIEINT